MILGMTPLVFIHTLISLVAIFTGFVVLLELLAGNRVELLVRERAVFLRLAHG